ncbi:CorA family divalent cation transporter [Mariprofundus ferrooxydans]|uniref:CorA family divalent cation transporter n=1 Tax=Mariprofundus ferrooxydans TaxID=314344 RepID=UPI0003772850|nr:CorA family divalent cation transporter [Mariprofundus ferrooxydans]
MSIEKMTELLNKQKLVEAVSLGQESPRHELIETVVHRQHKAELQHFIASLPTGEISSILETLRLDDARLLWEQIPQERENDILWELVDERRQELVGDREPSFTESQLNAFELVDGKLRQIAITGRGDLESVRPVWVDLLNVTKAERQYVGQHFGLSLPDPGDTIDLEVSSRFHIEENGAIHFHSNFLLDRDDDARSIPVAFILYEGILFSMHNAELPAFRLQRRRARLQPGSVSDCHDLLLDLYSADIEYSADALEDMYDTLRMVGNQVLSETMSDAEAAAILADIAEEEDMNGRIRSNILDTQRALSFLLRCKILMPHQQDDARQTLQDIESLNSHTSFLFGKINFLMDATIGFININQNKRVSQLTIFGVVFMPINILAGMGGMSEFSMMTKGIPWPIAYASFAVGVGLLGWFTYVLLRHMENKRLRQRGKVF